jgi:hypothetical protein
VTAAPVSPALQPPMRPASVTVIGWVWLVVGIVRTLGSASGLLLWRFGGVRESLMGRSPLSSFLPAPVFRAAFGHFGAALVLQLASGLLFLWSAVDLWRLRPWARVAIQIYCGLGICFLAAFTAFWLFFWFGPMAPLLTPSSRRVAAGAVLLVGGGLAAAFASMIRALRSDEVRRAFSAQSTFGTGSSTATGGFA